MTATGRGVGRPGAGATRVRHGLGALLAVAVLVAAAVVFMLAKERTVATWSFVKPDLEPPFDVEDLVFVDGVGLVFGHHLPGEIPPGSLITEIMAREEAAILRLAPGEPAWRQVYRGKGAMQQASAAGGGVLYALGSRSFQDGSRVASLEKSVDRGETWRPLPPPPPQLIGIRFAAPGRGIGWTDKAVLATKDDGASWKELAAFAAGAFGVDGLAPAIDGQGGVWAAQGARLRRVTKEGAADVALQAGAHPDWLEGAPDGAVWVASRLGENGQVAIDRVEPGRPPERRATLQPFLPVRLHVDGQLVLLVGCDVGEGDRAPEHFLQVSSDGGRTWSREKPAAVSRLTPIQFGPGGEIRAYAGMGRLQRRGGR